jgi:hypothetical protein
VELPCWSIAKKASPPINELEGWRFKQAKTADSYLEGAAAGALSVLVFVDFLDFLDFLVLDVDFVVVDLSSAANVPRLMERANIATKINDSNFFMGLPPCNWMVDGDSKRPDLNEIR